MNETASNCETSKKNLPTNTVLHPKQRHNLKYTNLNILCFADRASWYNSGQMTNLMHNYVV